MASPLAIGIDLGTTLSAVAWVQADGRTAMVPNSEGEILTPSVVLFEDHDIIAGKQARLGGILKPHRVAETVKRDMGSAVYSRPVRGEYLPPEVIQACVLRKLKADVTERLEGDPRFVITVPAFFDEPRRRSTAQAAEMAGLEILDIVNEPTAAALAFGEQLGYLQADGTAREKLQLLVYDLGGGTFDVTLVTIEPGDFRTVATDGDVQLGGHDWDMRLVDHVAAEFIKQHRKDPREDPSSLKRLLFAVEEAKHALTARHRAVIRVDHDGSWSEIPVARETFEQITADLLERTAHTTRQVLSAAGQTWDDIDRVLLVGGSTRMPMVARLIERMAGRPPDHGVHPDEAVARGAAIYAHYLLCQQGAISAASTLQVTDVNSHSLGIEGIDTATLRKKNVVLIPRNTPLPARVTDTFVTKQKNQPSVIVQVLEGESTMPDECAAIGRTVIRHLPKLPKGSPIEVTYEYGTNGRLNVRAVVTGTDREISLELERDDALSEARVRQWNKVLNTPAVGLNAFAALDDLIDQVLGDDAEDTRAPAIRKPAEAGAKWAGSKPADESRPASWAGTNAPAATASTSTLQPTKVSVPAATASKPREAARPAAGPATAPARPVPTPPTAVTGINAPAMPPARPAASRAAPVPMQRPVPARNNSIPASAFQSVVDSNDEDGWLPKVISVSGHIIFSLVGLALGYYLLCWLQPEQFNFLNLPLPGRGR